MAAAPIARFAVQLGLGGLSVFLRGGRAAVGMVGALSSAMGTLLSVVKSIGIAFTAITAVVSGFILINARAIDTVGKLNQKLGLSTDFIQKFRFAAQQAGVETLTTDLALQRFVRRLGEAQKNTGELLPALRRMGIQLKDNSGNFKSAEEVLFEFADGLQKTRQDTTKLALAFKAFDSEGAALVALLDEGSDALREFFLQADALGFVLENDAIKRVEEFNDNFNELVNVVRGGVQQFVGALAPALKVITEDLKGLVLEVTDGEFSFKKFGEYLKNQFFEILITAARLIDNIIIGFGEFANKAIRIANALGLFDAFKSDVEELESTVSVLIQSARKSSNLNFGNMEEDLLKVITQLQSFGVETSSYEATLDKLRTANENVDFFNIIGKGNINSQVRSLTALLGEVGLEVVKLNSVSEGGFFFRTTPSPEIQAVIEYLEKLKDATSDIGDNVKDVIEEVVVTAPQTLFQKIFGLERVRMFWEAYDKEGSTVLDKLGGVAKLLLGENVIEQLRESLSAAGFGDFERTLAEGLKNAALEFEDALTNAFMTGELSLKKFGDLLKETLFKAFIQKTITNPIGQLIGLASGGPAQAGTPYLIGEEGPEIFVPNSSGTVIPNDKIGGGSGMATTNIHYTINATDPASFQAQIARDPEFIFAVTQAGRRRLPGGI